MSGTRAGAKKAVARIKAREPEFFARIGAIGGARSTTGGFATYAPCNCKLIKGEHHKAQCAGLVGGKKSRRGKKVA